MKTKKKKAAKEFEEYLAVYKSIENEIALTNLNLLKIFSFFGVAIFFLLGVSTFFIKSLKGFRETYLCLSIVSAIILWISSNLKNKSIKNVRFLVYFFITCLWISEIILSTVILVFQSLKIMYDYKLNLKVRTP